VKSTSLRISATIIAMVMPLSVLSASEPATAEPSANTSLSEGTTFVADGYSGESEWSICKRSCDHVWSSDNQQCRKIPEKQHQRRERCWRRANEALSACYRKCSDQYE